MLILVIMTKVEIGSFQILASFFEQSLCLCFSWEITWIVILVVGCFELLAIEAIYDVMTSRLLRSVWGSCWLDFARWGLFKLIVVGCWSVVIFVKTEVKVSFSKLYNSVFCFLDQIRVHFFVSKFFIVCCVWIHMVPFIWEHEVRLSIFDHEMLLLGMIE